MPRRYKRKEKVQKTCEWDHKTFWTNRVDARFCNNNRGQCRHAAWKAKHPVVHVDDLKARLLRVIESIGDNRGEKA